MSVSDKLMRLSAAHDAIAAAITNKGGTVNAGDGFEDFAADIATIPTGVGGPAPIYGVSGLYASAVALTRTDDAVGMDYLINSSTGAVDSDFDDVFPWNEAEIVTLNAGKFLRLPKMYFRIGVDNSHRVTDIAVSKEQGNTGSWYEVEGFDVACYGASVDGTALKSVTGVSRENNLARGDFRIYAQNAGTGYFQCDLYHRTVLQFLWLIEFATKNSGSVMTGRVYNSGTQGGSSNSRLTGGTDGLSTPSGFETEYAQMRWHYIEDFVGNVCEYNDGVILYSSGAASYVTNDPTHFTDLDNTLMSILSYKNANTDSGNCVAALGWDANHPFMCIPIEAVNDGDYQTYFCDSFICATNKPAMTCGSNSDTNIAPQGVFYSSGRASTFRSGTTGSRLLHSYSA